MYPYIYVFHIISFHLLSQIISQFEDHGHLTMTHAFIVRIEYGCGKMTMAQVVSISVKHGRGKKNCFIFSIIFMHWDIAFESL